MPDKLNLQVSTFEVYQQILVYKFVPHTLNFDNGNCCCQKYDPVFVDYDRPLTPPKIPVKPYPKRVTEDDVRNNPPTVRTHITRSWLT